MGQPGSLHLVKVDGVSRALPPRTAWRMVWLIDFSIYPISWVGSYIISHNHWQIFVIKKHNQSYIVVNIVIKEHSQFYIKDKIPIKGDRHSVWNEMSPSSPIRLDLQQLSLLTKSHWNLLIPKMLLDLVYKKGLSCKTSWTLVSAPSFFFLFPILDLRPEGRCQSNLYIGLCYRSSLWALPLSGLRSLSGNQWQQVRFHPLQIMYKKQSTRCPMASI